MSGINLQKGQKVDLTKSNPSVTKYRVGLGWNANANVGAAFDLDVSAFVLGADGKRLSDSHFVFYNNLESPNKFVTHTGDNRTGAGDGDDESLVVEFANADANAEKIAFVVTIHDAETNRQNFGQVSGSYIRVMNDETGEEILRYDLGEDYSIETAMLFGTLYKNNDEWKFEAAGVGQQGGLQSFVNMY